MQKCPQYLCLAFRVEELLQALKQTTLAQLVAFQEKDSSTFTRLDKQLEQLVGEKERAIGAMREHAKEHKCQPMV